MREPETRESQKFLVVDVGAVAFCSCWWRGLAYVRIGKEALRRLLGCKVVSYTCVGEGLNQVKEMCAWLSELVAEDLAAL